MEQQESIENLVRNGLSALTIQVEGSVPDQGPFTRELVVIAHSDPRYLGKIELAVGPWVVPAGNTADTGEWKQKRYFEVKVYTPDGESDSSQWIFSGTKQALLDYLKNDPGLVENVLESAGDCVLNLRRHFL